MELDVAMVIEIAVLAFGLGTVIKEMRSANSSSLTMLSEIRDCLKAQGIYTRQIHSRLFGSAGAQPPTRPPAD